MAEKIYMVKNTFFFNRVLKKLSWKLHIQILLKNYYIYEEEEKIYKTAYFLSFVVFT